MASVFPARSSRHWEEKGAQRTQSQLQEPKATLGHDIAILAYPGAVSLSDPLVVEGPILRGSAPLPTSSAPKEKGWRSAGGFRGDVGYFCPFLSRWVICRRGRSSPMPRLCGLPKFHCSILGLSFLPPPTCTCPVQGFEPRSRASRIFLNSPHSLAKPPPASEPSHCSGSSSSTSLPLPQKAADPRPLLRVRTRGSHRG